MSDDTIFALASAPGRAGVAVFRLSGNRARAVLTSLSGRETFEPRKAIRVRLCHGGEIMDDGLALVFPGPRSFTGEDVVELHTHGGTAVSQAVTGALLDLGLRPAEAGEFSKRAFLNGKLDLTRAEAIADLVDAETAAQRRQALRQMDGGLARLVENWRAELVRALALVEAVIDFSDEGVSDDVVDEAKASLTRVSGEMATHLADNRRGERLRDGLHVAILGAPNAGKSSLLNRLAGREAAIVSASAGTTRDVIEIHLDLGGWPVVLADTAGLREAGGDIEAEGIRRALAKAEAADLKLAIFDAGALPHLDAVTLALLDEQALVVLNKCDLANELPASIAGHQAIAVSARDGIGMEDLLTRIEAEISARFAVSEAPSLTRGRHRAAVEECLSALARFNPALGIELAGEDLRLAVRALGRITGRVEVDEILDVVFGEFCIGK